MSAIKIVKGTDEQCEKLGLSKDENIHIYSRLCMLDNKPAFIEQEYVSEARFLGLWEHDIAQAIIMLFDRVYGVRSVRDQMVISQSQFPVKIAKKLKLEESAEGIILEQSVF